jgi:hypothetical protein
MATKVEKQHIVGGGFVRRKSELKAFFTDQQMGQSMTLETDENIRGFAGKNLGDVLFDDVLKLQDSLIRDGVYDLCDFPALASLPLQRAVMECSVNLVQAPEHPLLYEFVIFEAPDSTCDGVILNEFLLHPPGGGEHVHPELYRRRMAVRVGPLAQADRSRVESVDTAAKVTRIVPVDDPSVRSRFEAQTSVVEWNWQPGNIHNSTKTRAPAVDTQNPRYYLVFTILTRVRQEYF